MSVYVGLVFWIDIYYVFVDEVFVNFILFVDGVVVVVVV